MNVFKSAITKVALLSAIASPFTLTACNSSDVAYTVGAVGASVAAYALNDNYYRNDCYGYQSDYYCRDNWNGWEGRPWYNGGYYGFTSAKHSGAHLANAELIAGGLKARFHIDKSAANRLGQAFASARAGDLNQIHQLGFTSEDLNTIGKMQPLTVDRLQAIGARLGMSASKVNTLIAGLQEEYQRNH